MRKRDSWWTMAHANALKLAIARHGTQAQLLEKIDLTRSSLIEILAARSTPKRETLDQICAAIGIDVDDLLAIPTEEIEDTVSAPDEMPPIPGAVLIQEISLAYGLGATFVDGMEIAETARYFPADWVRRYTSSPPSQLRFAPGKGNSMSPTIDDGDIMLVDLAETSPSFADLIWVCAIGEMGMVKRLATRADGTIVIKSDNPSVRDDYAADGEIHIVGRVVAVIKRT